MYHFLQMSYYILCLEVGKEKSHLFLRWLSVFCSDVIQTVHHPPRLYGKFESFFDELRSGRLHAGYVHGIGRGWGGRRLVVLGRCYVPERSAGQFRRAALTAGETDEAGYNVGRRRGWAVALLVRVEGQGGIWAWRGIPGRRKVDGLQNVGVLGQILRRRVRTVGSKHDGACAGKRLQESSLKRKECCINIWRIFFTEH